MKNVHFAIPEIYGDSLSYYDLLSKLVKAMNTVIENYNTIPDQIAEEVKNLDASQLFSAVLNQLIHSIATDNTKSANAVKVYKKHDLLYATFNETVNLYESLIDFTTGTETELIVGTNIREVNISELFIELRKLIDINKNNIEAVTAVANENSAEIATIHGDITAIENKNAEQDNEIATIHRGITAIENKNTEQDNEITTIHGNMTAIENKNTEQDNELNTLRTMLSTPYKFKGEVASISALPSTGNVNDTYYVQDVKYKVTWTGSAWVQSSLSEADYQTELSELKEDLSRLYEDLDFLNGRPLEYSMTWIDGKYIDSSNGDLIPYNGWHYTDYIALENNDDLYVSTSNVVDNEYNAFYDSNKAFIRNLYINGNSDHYIINYVPQNAKYVRLSCESKYSINLYPITTVADLDERVTTLEAEKSQQLPSYYSDYMTEKNTLVNTKMDLISNCLAFVFFTDPHIGSNKLKSPKMIDSILKNTSVKDVICGGDVISAYGGHNRIVRDCEIYKESYGFAKPYYVRGNHDNYAKLTEDATTGIIKPNSMVINRFIRPYHDDIVIENGKTYYYFDRPLNKVRFISIDTNEIIRETTGTSGEFQPSYSITQEQIDWFVNTLKNTPNGYKIVLLSHSPINSNLAWAFDESLIFGDIVESFNNKSSINKTDNYAHLVNTDFSNTNGKVILSISGHGHADDSFVSDSGCVYYEVNCDTLLNNGGSPYERIEGTVSEQSFDVVIINVDNGDIHTVRYGAGIDKTLISH